MRRNAYYPAVGGENHISPALTLQPGELLFSDNYEPDPYGRPRRIDGYERFDGMPRPSEGSYWVLNFDAGVAAISEGDTVTGFTSGVTGKALIDAVVTSGSYGTSDAVGYLVLTEVTGNYIDDENLQVSAVTKSVANGTGAERGATLDTDDVTWHSDAIETRRALIGAVPGSGAMRGVWVYEGDTYAFRDNAGATACVMHKATTSGWVAQDLGGSVAFTAGTVAFTVGNTLTGGTSFATGTIGRVVVTSGDWATNDAAGTVYLYGISGTYQAETITDGGGGSATCSGAQTVHALSAGGRYEFVNENFYGQSTSRRMYGVNGLDKAFEWDGSQFIPISTGAAVDTPTHITAHVLRLVVSIGSSLLHSVAGDPLDWTTGAGEIATGDEIKAFVSMQGGVLGIFCKDSLQLLYGDSTSNWERKTLAKSYGCSEWTVQRLLGMPVFFDDDQILSTNPTPDFGDFNTVPMSDRVRPVLKGLAAYVSGSIVSKRKSHYRLYVTEGTTTYSLTMGLNREGVTGFMRQSFPLVIRVICAGEDANGVERIFFGSDDGYIYEMDSGNSFDGAAIEATLVFAYNHCGYPDRRKRYFKVEVELDAGNQFTLQGTPDFNYGDTLTPTGKTQNVADDSGNLLSKGGLWGNAVWSEFIWGNPSVATGWIRTTGVGRNMSLTLYSSESYPEPHTIQGYQLQYSIHGQRR